MRLYHLSIVAGQSIETPVCEFPSNLASSQSGLSNFLRLYASRIFGGREGRDWRICPQPRCLIPLTVNQLVPVKTGAGAMAGCKEYGDQLIIK